MKKISEKYLSNTNQESPDFKIIVIEDDAGLNLLIRKKLMREGFQVDWAGDGKKALDTITGHENEVLLVDYKLPDMSGKELIEEVLRKFDKPTHFIIMTGFGDEKIAVEMFKLGARDYIVKEAGFIDLLPEKLKQVCLAVEQTRRLKDLENELRIKNQLLNETGRMARVGGWEVDLESKAVVWSDVTKEIHETPVEYVPRIDEAINFYSPEARPLVEDALAKAIKNGKQFTLELPLITAKGRKIWVHAAGKPEMKNGKCVRLYGTFQDITARKQNEKQLLDLNTQLSLAQNIAKLGYWTYDIKTQLPKWTDECFNMYNIPKEKGEPLFQEQKKFIHPDDWDLYESAVQKAITDDMPYDIQIRLVHHDKSIVWMRTKGLPRKNRKGEVVELFGIVQDITDFKEAEIALQKAKEMTEGSEAQLKLLFEKSPDFIIISNMKGEIVKCNEATLKFHNFSSLDEFQNYLTHDFYVYPKEREELVAELLQKGSLQNKEVRFKSFGSQIEIDCLVSTETLKSNVNETLFITSIRDISNIKKQETKLVKAKEKAEESEYKVRNMFENTEIGIIYCNTKGDVLEANPAILDILGSPSIEVSKKVNLLTHQPLQEIGFSQNVAKCIAEKTKIVEDVVYTSNYGKTVYLKYYLVPVVVNSQVVGVWINLNNLTDQWNTRKELIAAKEKAEENALELKEAQKISHVGSWHYDVKTQKPKWSEEMLRIWGFDSQEPVQNYQQHKKYIHPEDWDNFETTVNNAINSGISYHLELRIVRPNGEERTIITHGEPVFDSNGNVISLRGTVQDVTDLKMTERKLIDSELKFRNIAENVPGLVLRYQSFPDGSGKLLFVSKGVEDIYEISREDAINDVGLLWNRIHPDDLEDYVNSVVEAGKTLSLWKREHRILLPDGRVKWLRGIAMPVKQDDGSVVFDTLGVDITNRKRFEQDLMEAKERAELNKEKFKMLNSLTSEMLLQPDIKSIYTFITENLQKLHPDTIVLIVSVDESGRQTRLEVVSGIDNSLLKKIINISGFDPIGKTYHLTDDHHNYFKSGSLVEFHGGLAAFSAAEFPAFAANALEKLIGLHKIYTIGINKDDGLLAAIHFLTFNKQVITDASFIEVFVKQAGLVLQKKMDEKALKIAKENAEQSKKRFQRLIENAPDGVSIINKEGKLIYVSPNSYRHFGYSENEIIGHSGDEFTHPDDLNIVYTAFDTIIRNPDQKAIVKYRFRKKSGEYRWIETTFANLLDDETIAGFVLNFSDVTEKEQVLDELVVAKEKAEESDRLKSAFLANMSHEIRTPMNAILGFTDLLRAPNLTGTEQQDYIDIIQNSGNRMLNTVNDIIDISKIESGLVDVTFSEVNIHEQLKYLYAFFSPEATKKGVRLIINNNLTEQTSLVKTDLKKLGSILTNLIKNAIKYTHEGSIEFGCHFKEGVKAAELEFYVKDTGIGIPKNRQMAIFDRFVQADIEDKDAMQGSGLGLAISKAYTEMLGGKLWLESKEGVGSTFRFSIPFQKPEDKKRDDAVRKSYGQTAPIGKKLKILVAEDDEVSFQHLYIIVKARAKDIIHAKNGIETVEL